MFCGPEKKDSPQDPDDCKKIQKYIYKQSDKVGEGNFSQVFHGVDSTTGKSVAIKVVKYSSLTSKVAEQLLKNQASILKELRHQNVVRCLDIFSSKNNCYIITEFYEGGDLEKLLEKKKVFHEKEISKLVYQIYKGLLYLNQIGVVHRDFKLANIFLDELGNPKIADFGFAVKSNKPFKDINIGSPIYMSPQGMLLHQYGPKTQVWAFGVMIYQLLHGDTPLSSCRSERELREKIMLPPYFRDGISIQCRKFVDLCMTVDPKHRIQMKDLIQTPYMAKIFYQNQKVPSLNMIQSSKQPSTMGDLSSTIHSSMINPFSMNKGKTNPSKNIHNFLKMIKYYEEGLALLHYCRLIHKTAKSHRSSVLSQWLLNICSWLPKMRLQGGDREKNQKLISIIQDYFLKYRKQHAPMHELSGHPTIQEVQVQIQALLTRSSQSIQISSFSAFNRSNQQGIKNYSPKSSQNNLIILQKQTELLRKALQTQNPKVSNFSKNSQSERYLGTLKYANRTSNQQSSLGPFHNK